MPGFIRSGLDFSGWPLKSEWIIELCVKRCTWADAAETARYSRSCWSSRRRAGLMWRSVTRRRQIRRCETLNKSWFCGQPWVWAKEGELSLSASNVSLPVRMWRWTCFLLLLPPRVIPALVTMRRCRSGVRVSCPVYLKPIPQRRWLIENNLVRTKGLC